MVSLLTTHLWQSTFFAVAAGLLTLAFRGNRAQVRYWLWLSASLKFFIPFAVLMYPSGRKPYRNVDTCRFARSLPLRQSRIRSNNFANLYFVTA